MNYEKKLNRKGILITGGLGFIGSNLARKFVEMKNSGISIKKIVIVDSLIDGCGGNIFNIKDIENEIEVCNYDIGDSEKMKEIVRDIDFIFNLAGQTGHQASMENPLLDLELNYKSHLNFLEVCRKINPKAVIVYASTRQFYGEPEFLPVTEKHPINPPDINGINKFAAEQLHMLYSRVYGLNCCSLRLTNIFGERQRIKDAKTGVLGFFIGLSLKNEPITLFEPGTQIRDIAYIDDVVNAFLLAAINIEKTNSKVFNIGGEKISLLDFAKLLVKINGGNYVLKPFPPEKKKIDIGDFYSDYSKFTEATGWKPKISIEEGIKNTVEFYKKNLQHYF